MRFLTALCFLTVLLPPGQTAEKVIQDEWMGLYLGGRKAGYSHTWIVEKTVKGTTTYVSNEKTVLTIKRMGQTMKSIEDNSVVEDAAGRLISFTSKKLQSAQVVRINGRIEGEHLVVTRKQSGLPARIEKQVYDPAALAPYAVERLRKQRGLKKGLTYSVKAFLPSMPDRAMLIKFTHEGQEVVEVMGEKKHLWRITSMITLQGMTINTIEWVSDSWVPWKVSVMNGMLKGCKLPRELACKEGKVGEMFLSTLVAPQRKIPNARQVRKLDYQLSLPAGEKFQAFPSGVGQTVTKDDGNVIELKVRTVEVDKPLSLPITVKGMAKYLAATPFLQSDDKAISKKAITLVGDQTNSLVVAQRMEKWVCRSIKKKHMGVGFATAAEVMKNLEGDCSEHAVLLAALCRAAGIPSRIVAGLIYADALVARKNPDVGAFGWHMWTEVYVGKWVPLDATLGMGFCDATHIAMAKSDLENESSMFRLVPVGLYIGRLKLVVETPAKK